MAWFESWLCNYYILFSIVENIIPPSLTSVPSILQQGNAELGKLMNVRLEKLKLFQSQNVQDKLINQSVYGGKIASNFIDQPMLHHLKPKHPALSSLLLFSTLFWQLLLKLIVNLFNSILN